MPKLNPDGPKLLAALMAGCDAKEAAIRTGMSWSYATRLARDAGLVRRLITPDEWEAVLLARAGGGVLGAFCPKPVVESCPKKTRISKYGVA